jgi:hypothetical protein
MHPSILFDIIEDEFIEDLLNFVVITSIDGENTSKDISCVIYSLINGLGALDLRFVLVPSLGLGVKQVNVVVGSPGFDVGNVRS